MDHQTHLACEQGRKLMAVMVTAGQRGDSPQFIPVPAKPHVVRARPTRPDIELADPQMYRLRHAVECGINQLNNTARWPPGTTRCPLRSHPHHRGHQPTAPSSTKHGLVLFVLFGIEVCFFAEDECLHG